MASTFRKYRRLSSRIMLLCTTFLVFICVGECRRCYWCGPLADQVHRSRRAPPCLTHGNQMAACDPDRNYCAVVATAPPHVESRFCVKIYQDECYPLFCNTTRTWKMVCPCRGDLCNGANSDRENEAFIYLAKLARTNTYRLRKRDTTDQELDPDQATASDAELMNNAPETRNYENTDENVPETTSINTVDGENTVESQMVTESKEQDMSTESYRAAGVDNATPLSTDDSDSDTNNVIKTEQSDELNQQQSNLNNLPTITATEDSASSALDDTKNSVTNPSVTEIETKTEQDDKQNTYSTNPGSLSTSSIVITSFKSSTDGESISEGNSAVIIDSTMEMADEPRATEKTIAMKEINVPTAEARQEQETVKPEETSKLTTIEHSTINANKTETATTKTTIPTVHTTKPPSKNDVASLSPGTAVLIITSVSFMRMFS